MWFTRAASWAAVINVLVASLGFYWPVLTAGSPRAILITTIIVALAAINIRGIRQSSFVVNVLTVGKLVPLRRVHCRRIFFVDWARLRTSVTPSLGELSASGLLLIFAFGGYEVVPVPGGEARNPRRDVPFALIMTIIVVTLVMTLAQIVAVGTLPGLAASKTPLADAAALFLGAGGAAMITLGAVFSTSGNNMGQALSGSRNLFALAEQGDLPPFFGRVHPTFRTPINAILVTAGVALALALSGTFQTMAAASAISRLVVLRCNVCVDAAASQRPVRRRRQTAGVRCSVRADCAGCRNRYRDDDSRRGHAAAAPQRRRSRSSSARLLYAITRTPTNPLNSENPVEPVRHQPGSTQGRRTSRPLPHTRAASAGRTRRSSL